MVVPLHRILVNTVVEKDSNFLILQRSFEEEHMPGKWTIPGGKVEHTVGDVWNVLESTAFREVREETGVEIGDIQMVANNSFIHTTGEHVVAIIFLGKWKAGEARPLEDSINVAWINQDEIRNYDFAPNISKYLETAIKFLNNARA